MKPPLLPASRVIAAFLRAGYSIVHQKGSHIKLRNDETGITLIVPNHKEVDRWTLKGILKDAEMDIATFLKLL